MNEQIRLFEDESNTQSKAEEKKKRNWENRFQNWSNNEALDNDTSINGKCGYGSMCDYCSDNSYGRPCVRALNAMCREKGIYLNYDLMNFEDVWNGEFASNNDKENSNE